MSTKKNKWGDPVIERFALAAGAKNKSDLARKMNVRPSTVSGWTYKKRYRRVPSEVIQQVSELYNVSLDWLRYGVGEMYLPEGVKDQRRAS